MSGMGIVPSTQAMSSTVAIETSFMAEATARPFTLSLASTRPEVVSCSA